MVEKLSKVKSIIMNKTGTVTEKEFRLVGIFPKSISEAQFVSIITSIESKSNHPIALALGADSISEPEIEFKEIQGKGIVGLYRNNEIIAGNAKLLSDYQIKCDVPEIYGTAVHLAVNSNYCGYMVFENKTRTGTYDVIEKIRDCGIDSLYMLSCDLQSTVQPISQALGFNVFKSELDNESKISSVNYIVENKYEGSTVAYVGDIGEKIPYSCADISMCLGNDDEADVCINDEGISALPDVLQKAKWVYRLQKINLYISLISKCLVLFLLLLGVNSAIPAAVILILCAIFTFVDLHERIRL